MGLITAFYLVFTAIQQQLRIWVGLIESVSRLLLLLPHGLSGKSEFKAVATDRVFYATPRAVKIACVKGRPTLIYRAHNASTAYVQRNVGLTPAELTSLKELADRAGVQCLEDRRKSDCAVVHERRRGTQFVLLSWLLGLSTLSIAADSQNGFYSSAANNATKVQVLGLFSTETSSWFENHSNRNGETPSTKKNSPFLKSLNSTVSSRKTLGYNAEKFRIAKAILQKKWRKSDDDYEELEEHLDELAQYLAAQPNAFDLLVSLKNKPLRLVYSPANFTTVVKGSQFHVRSATIYFDPKSAAVLSASGRCDTDPGYCVASPADAFIHELIHAKIALLEPKRFIKSGALNSLMYPYAHEREVLSEERAIYQAMTSVDHKPRPRRHSHSGHLQAAACVSCI